MKNIQYEVNSHMFLPECWIFQNRKYLHWNSSNRMSLPTLPKGYEEVFEQLGIPYRVITVNGYEKCEYWDPENYAEEDITLPTYVKMPNGTYRNIKSYTGKVPTFESIQSALKLEREEVEKAQYEYELRMREKETFLYLKDELKGKAAVVLFTFRCQEEKVFIFDEDRIKVIPVYVLSRDGVKKNTGWFATFDVNKIELNSIVTLKVPTGKVGMVIGTNHWQVNEWCEKLGLKEINVVEN